VRLLCARCVFCLRESHVRCWFVDVRGLTVRTTCCVVNEWRSDAVVAHVNAMLLCLTPASPFSRSLLFKYYCITIYHSRLRCVLVLCTGSVDALMESMKTQCASLSGVYERSDAMLAVYPGEGARFAKHIDNTTGACAAL
jgi:hypothetical protein